MIEEPAIRKLLRRVTSLVIQDVLGGDILKTRLPDGRWHFYNRIDGKRSDFTDEQLGSIQHDSGDVN